MNNYILILITVLTGFTVFAGNETYSVRREGTALVTSSTVPLFSVYDGQYYTMHTTSWQSQFVNKKVSNFLRLGINPDVAQTNVLNGSMTFDLKVWTWDAVNSEFDVTTISDVVLSLYYEHTNPTTVLVDEMSTYDFSGAHRVDVFLKTITNTSGFNLSEVFVQSDMVVERSYTLDNSAVTGLDIDAVAGSPFYEFQWNPKSGAEWYELEWVHVQNTKLNGATQSDLTKLSYDYYLNSTRVVVKGNSYRIPAILDKGWLLFRVRPIGFKGPALNVRKEGAWSTTAESGTVNSHTAASKLQITVEYDPGMNWSHQVAYGDDGERFESVAFSDGLGRARQTVAHNTETKQAVVSNVYYDELGRPVIADLPTPTDDNSLKHYPGFNKADGTTQPFSVQYFNSGMSDNCSPSGAGFSTASGAGKYYSPSNPDQDGENKRIPDAKKYPYSRVVYENDFSGRVQKVSGYGDSLRTGSGRETFYFYPSANQEELNRLFGAEVGYASHYSKMVTVDPNGQIYVQYADMAGRVIATYLAGDSPASLDAIEGNGGSNVTVGLLPLNKQTIDTVSAVPSSTLTYHEFIYADGAYTFNYAMTPQQFRNACMAEDICFDCVYDLEFRILDACDDSVYTYTETLMGYDLDKLCNDPGKAPETFTSPALSLQKGAYTIVKTLSINQEKLKENWCYYIENSSCVEPLADVFNELYEAESFDLCNETVDDLEDMTGCEAYREAMLRDMMPGGQYAQFVNTSGTYTALPNSSSVHSVLTEDNLGTNEDWRNPVGGYKDEDGNPALVNGVAPETLSLQDFIENFQPSWAEALLPYHPEHCFLVECEQNEVSNDYDATMLATWTFDDACAIGFFEPLASSVGLPGCTASEPDPFFDTGGNGSTLNTAMNDAMNDYQESGYSIWKMAIYEAYCNSTGDITTCYDNFTRSTDNCYKDLVWITYRRMYLELKSQFVYQAMNAACDNSAIGVHPDWIGFSSRWGNIYQLTDVDTDGAGPDTGNTLDQAYFDGLIQQSCETACEAFADDWIEQLAGCDFAGNAVDMVDLRNDLIAVCMSGCDSEHPMGSTTAPPGYSGDHYTIHDVLRDHLGGSYETNLCSELLISNPGPYRSNDELENLVNKPLDICGCEAVMQAQWEASNDNPNGWTIEQILAVNTGVTLEDAHYLICACDKAIAGDYEPGNVTWIPDVQTYLDATKITIPATLACSGGNGCTDCDEVMEHVATLNARFSGITDFEDAENYSTILTNYLNNELGFHLSYYDYVDFIGKCNADLENPYCTVTPEAKEWAEVMKLIAFRGQLLNGSGNAVDLLAQNIVYENGDLQYQLPGNQYWSSVAGDVLTVHVGTTGGSDCSFGLTLPDSLGFEFTDIVSFGTIVPLTGNCSENTTFKIGVTYRDCGELSNAWLTGTSECLEINDCVCDTAGLRLCDELPSLEITCYQPRLNELYQQAETSYLEAIDAMYLPFIREFNSACAAAFSTETLSYTGPRNTYQYTLFYYDQAGNLAKTVAPAGVNLAFNPVSADQAREEVQSSTVFTPPTSFGATNPMPVHTFETTYKYNSYDQLVNTTNPDQTGATRYFYDYYGRLVLSQNPVQADDKKYSYVLYDAQGRPIESGQIDRDIPPSGGGSGYIIADITETQLKTKDLGVTIKNWIYSGVRTEVTYTVYDKPLSGTISAKFAAGSQQNLRLRVATVMYFDAVALGAAMPTSGYASATHYSYDLHGNVIETLQDVPALAPVQQDIKSTQYEFELISGNVEKVEYQKGKNDQTTHTYTYDKLNRLTEAHFSSDGGVHVNREAHYRYFDYGPMARVEIGQQKVQANDYTYTINGWLKGMNSNTLDPTRDGGKDGSTGYYSGNASAHKLIARDMNGYTLGYFQGDYASIGLTSFEATVGTGNDMANAIRPLFNGNIAHSVTAISGFDIQAGVYSYDQLQRLKKMRVFINQSTLLSSNSWAGSAETQEYYSDYSYDRNGNLLTLNRNGISSIGLDMDAFDYDYIAGTNRLRHVADGGTDYGGYDDIKTGQTGTNYQYDKLGQIVADVQEGMALEWRKGDKKLLLQRTQTMRIEYVYNPFGQRVLKVEKQVVSGVIQPNNGATAWKYTLYGYDANGQVLSTYTALMPTTGDKTANLDEQMIYDSERLGLVDDGRQIAVNLAQTAIPTVKKNQLGKKRYELTNWLGNVNAVITDRKQATGNNYYYLHTDGVNDYAGTTTFNPGLTTQVTLEAWMRSTDDVGTNAVCGQFNTTGDKGVVLRTVSGEIQMAGRDGTGITKFSGSSTTTVTDGEWHHVAGTFDGTDWKIYVDGVLESTGSYVAGGTLSGLNQPFYVGRVTTGVYFDGDVKEVSYWNYTKTASEIQADMATSFTGSETGLIGYWPLNDNTNPTADLSPNNRDATLANGAAFASETIYTYDAVAVMKADYYPFGMTMPGRSETPNAYRYAYNGMEQDMELKGQGNSYTTEFRQYDPRLGRWMSLDPLMAQFPHQSPFCGFDNNPVFYTDPYGLSATNKDGNPPAGAPTNPAEGDLYTDKAGGDWVYNNGEWLDYGDFSGGIVKNRGDDYELEVTIHKPEEPGFWTKVAIWFNNLDRMLRGTSDTWIGVELKTSDGKAVGNSDQLQKVKPKYWRFVWTIDNFDELVEMVETLDKYDKIDEFSKALKRARYTMKGPRKMSKNQYFKKYNLSGKGKANKVNRNKLYAEYEQNYESLEALRKAILKSNTEKARQIIKEVRNDVVKDAVKDKIVEVRTDRINVTIVVMIILRETPNSTSAKTVTLNSIEELKDEYPDAKYDKDSGMYKVYRSR